MKVERLRVKNFIIIEDVTIEPAEGLNVFTGETGAGKSLILGAMGVATGRRTRPEMIRPGKDRCEIELVLSGDLPPRAAELLQNAGFEVSDQLIIRRLITPKGSQTFLNEKAVSLAFLNQITAEFLEITSQHAAIRIKDPAHQLEILDEFAQVMELRTRFRELYEKYHRIKAQLEELEAKNREKERRMDVLRYEIDEILNANIQPGEEEELRSKSAYLKNVEQLREALNKTYEFLYSDEVSAYGLASSALTEITRVKKLSSELEELCETLESAVEALKDAALQAADILEGVYEDPEELEHVQERLALLHRLKKKYGATVEEIHSYLKRAQDEFSQLECLELDLRELQKEKEKLRNAMEDMARTLHHKRTKSAKVLCDAVCKEFKDLGITKGMFQIKIETSLDSGADSLTSTGADKIEFMFSANPDLPPQPLSKVASGGELARVLLALKKTLAGRSGILVFDEVDAGIGGKTVDAVALKLAELARHHQVFLVTHRAQIAARADAHFHVEKRIKSGRSSVEVMELTSPEKRIKEIAKLLSGDVSAISLKHAEELLERTHGEDTKSKTRRPA